MKNNTLIPIILIVSLVSLSMLLTGCNLNKLIEPILEKSYEVVIYVEQIVSNESPEDLMSKMNNIDQALVVLSQSLSFINKNINNPQTQDIILEVINKIDEVHNYIQETDIDDVAEIKQKIMDTMSDVKGAIESIADKLGIILDVTVKKNSNTVDLLNQSINELEKLIEE
ncbi:MAG: hypothetical protein WC119_00350 [Synergistaceae bacterium]